MNGTVEGKYKAGRERSLVVARAIDKIEESAVSKAIATPKGEHGRCRRAASRSGFGCCAMSR